MGLLLLALLPRAGVDPEMAGEAGDEVRSLASLIARATNARNAETRSSALQEARAELARFDANSFPDLARALRARLTELDPSFVAEFGETGLDVAVPAWVHTPEPLRRHSANSWPDRLGPSARPASMRHHQRQVAVADHVAGHPAQDQLAQGAVGVGAHHQA
jgi:hypothetical protein